MSSMLEATKTELQKHNVFTPVLNHHIQQVVDAINIPTVDPRMKATIAVTQIMAFASQFRRNIMLWDETSVPINTISFVITGSGEGKDSSVNAARKCFTEGYKILDSTRYSLAAKKAIEKARLEGEDTPENKEVYWPYMQPIPPVDIMPTTGPGLIQHINDIADHDITSGLLYSGEFSDELAYNQDMMENIKILSEVYDVGNKEMKYTKGAEHRSKAINGQPVSALFVGSPGHILYDFATKKKFEVAFMSKLARRSWFCYTPKRIPEPDFNGDIDAMIAYKENIEISSKQARANMSDTIKTITNHNISHLGEHITVPREVYRLFEVYKRYNSDLANSLPNQNSTYVLIRRHLQWKALKMAGALATMDLSSKITEKHYADAIRFCEMMDKDMELFEHDLNKSDHERFSDYISSEVTADGYVELSVHEIKKQGFISSVTKTKLEELVTLCTGYDKSGVYSIVNDGGAIRYELIIKTDILSVSYKSIDITALNSAVESGDADSIRAAKHHIAATTVDDFQSGETSFIDLANLLTKDLAYSPFVFENGVRGKDKIIGGTKWLVLDIDDSHMSASETSFLLSDLNHHIALSSDKNNEYKFRVLIELDSVVDLSPIGWKHFYLAVADDLALRVDPVPQSQIFYSYSDRPVISSTDASPLEVRPYLIAAKEREATKDAMSKAMTPARQKALLADTLETFSYAFESPWGSASRNVIRAMFHIKDLGGTLDEALTLFHDIQEYWEVPFEPQRADAMIAQIERMF